jgi:hypothetical protein
MRIDNANRFLKTFIWIVLLTAFFTAQSAGQDSTSQLVGKWQGTKGSSRYNLVLNADQSGNLNGMAIQWSYAGGTLILTAAKGTFHYKASFNNDSLTLSGSDLQQPLEFQRVDASSPSGLLSEPGGADTFPIAGNPPLTRGMVNKAANFFDWLLDAKLTVEQRQQFQDSVVRSWKNQNQDEIQSTVNVIKFSDDLEKKSPEERELYRVQLRTKFLELMRQSPNDVLSQWVLTIYDSAHKPIARGNPPLTRQDADAYAEVVSFMITEVMGKKGFNPDRKFKDDLTQYLVGSYGNMTPEEQRSFSQIPVLWAALRMKWSKASAAERQHAREQWTPAINSMLASQAQGNGPGQQSSSSRSNTSRDEWFAKNSEHMWVNSMANSSFATTMSLNLNKW